MPYYIYALHEKSRWRRLQAAVGVLRACLEFRPDVIYLNQSGAYSVVLPAATILNLPVVAHVRIYEDAGYLARRRPKPSRLASIVAISDSISAEIAQFPELSLVNVHRLYDAYAPSNSALPDPDRPARLACVGRIAPIKGQEVLVAALALLDAPGVECLFAGDGDNAFVASLKATSAGGGARAVWLGAVGDVQSTLRDCTLLVCPSDREPLGRVIFEAWDAGAVPVVFATSGGAAEVVSQAQGGVVCAERSPEALAAAIATALDLPADDRAAMSARGRNWMAANVDPDSYGAAMTRIFADAAQRRPDR